MQVYMHVNYFEAGYDLEDAFRHAQAIGYDGIELRDRDRSGKLPLAAYLQRTAELRRRFGLAITYGCRIHTTHDDPAAREASLAHALEVIRFAGGLGIQTLNAFAGPVMDDEPLRFSRQGSALAQEHHYEETCRLLAIAGDAAREQGITLCLETHNGYIHDNARPAADLVDRLGHPNVQVNFDYGNIMLNRHGEPLAEALEVLGHRIRYAHLKNGRQAVGDEEGRFLMTYLRDGDINNYFFVRDLLAAGYDGVLCLENTMKGDKLPAAIDDLAYLRELLQRAAAPAAQELVR